MGEGAVKSRPLLLFMKQIASIDIETTGLFPYAGDKMFSFCIGRFEGDQIVVEIHHLDHDEQARKRGIVVLQKFFNDTSVAKVNHNIKFDLTFIKLLGIQIPEETEFHDTMIMSQLLQNLAPSHGLKELAWKLRGMPLDLEKKVRQIAMARGGFHKVPRHMLEEYQVHDAQNPLLLYRLWEPILRASPTVWEDYRNEIDLILETIHMESFGICLDFRECRLLLERLETDLHQIGQNCLSTLGEIPNLNSSDQINYYLYKKYKLPILEYTPGGAPSSDKDVLLKLRELHPHPFLDAVLKQRSYSKGVAMLHGYMKHTDSSGIIHPNIKTNEARTGRQSSANPNLQNVSKSEGLKNPFPVPMRKIFRAQPGYVMHLADYAGIELRLIVDRAEENDLIAVLKRDEDPHELLSSYWYGDWVRPEVRWSSSDDGRRKVLRGAGKNANFAMPYGAGPDKIASALNLSLDETMPGFRAIRERWPRFAHFTNISAQKVLQNGYIETAFGRKLNVEKDIAYAGANYDIQGTAAGILKRAQVRVGKWLRKNAPEFRPVIPIHDEIIFNFLRQYLPDEKYLLTQVSKIMTEMSEIRVPLKVDWKRSTSTWDAARALKLD